MFAVTPETSLRRSVSRRHPLLFAALLTLAVAARGENWAPNVTVSGTWNDNVTNANLSTDKLSSFQTEAVAVLNDRFNLTASDSLHAGIQLAGEWWPEFSGLSRALAGVRGEWRHKFGLGPHVPIFSLEAAVDFVAANESYRSGTRAGGTLGYRQRFSDRWLLVATHEFSHYAARNVVFDRQGHETALELGHDLSELTRVSVRLSYRRGDVLSYATPPRPDLVALAPHRIAVDTFDRPMVAYSVDARTVGAKVSAIRALSEESAAIVSFEWRESERTGLRYVNQLVSFSLVHQF